MLHTHMPFASALTRLEEPHIEAIGQTEIGFIDCVAYDDGIHRARPRAGGGREAGRGARAREQVLFMANHGVLVVGETVAEAYDRLYYLERACQVQLYAMWTGRRLEGSPATDRRAHLAPVRRLAELSGQARLRASFRSLEAVARPP